MYKCTSYVNAAFRRRENLRLSANVILMRKISQQISRNKLKHSIEDIEMKSQDSITDKIKRIGNFLNGFDFARYVVGFK